jgi:hypothetical protein
VSISPAVRNVGIILLLALAVFALPGGGTGAAVIEALIGILFAVAIGLLLFRLYRENRITIDGLGERHRLILYASLASLVFVAASARRWWDDSVLTIAWFALLAAAVYGLVATWRHWREYA